MKTRIDHAIRQGGIWRNPILGTGAFIQTSIDGNRVHMTVGDADDESKTRVGRLVRLERSPYRKGWAGAVMLVGADKCANVALPIDGWRKVD